MSVINGAKVYIWREVFSYGEGTIWIIAENVEQARGYAMILFRNGEIYNQNDIDHILHTLPVVRNLQVPMHFIEQGVS